LGHPMSMVGLSLLGLEPASPPAQSHARRVQHRPARIHLPAGDRAGIERLVGYMICCPFSLSRLVKVAETGQVVYKAEKEACRVFPEPNGDSLNRGT